MRCMLSHSFPVSSSIWAYWPLFMKIVFFPLLGIFRKSWKNYPFAESRLKESASRADETKDQSLRHLRRVQATNWGAKAGRTRHSQPDTWTEWGWSVGSRPRRWRHEQQLWCSKHHRQREWSRWWAEEWSAAVVDIWGTRQPWHIVDAWGTE